MRILLIGTGLMSVDYAKVLKALDVEFVTVGRGEIKCAMYEEKSGCTAIRGGVESYLEKDSNFTHAIVASEAASLSSLSCFCMEKGIKHILTEKPGGLSVADIRKICDAEESTNSTVHIGYNRRLYASVLKAKQIIEEDGGVKSFNFEFTEWPHTVLNAGLPNSTLRSWFLCNSTHVVDTAFYLGGMPVELHTFSEGEAEWTDDHTMFCGCGKTETGALFNYSANWNAPGRWSIEMLTNKHRLIFKPLEKLQIQQLKTVKVEFDETIDYSVDTEYKPGLFREVSAFIGNCDADLALMKTMRQQLKMMETYHAISGRQY